MRHPFTMVLLKIVGKRRMHNTKYFSVFLAVGLSVISNLSHASCGSAFCMVNTNWNLQGLALEDGLRIDFHFEYIDQDQPTSGKNALSSGRFQRITMRSK